MNGADSAFSLLQSLSVGSPDEPLTIRDINDTMGERAFGIVILLFTLPNCFPIPGIPGVSLITGLPVVFFAVQLVWGAKHPYLPHWIQKYSITRGALAKMLQKAEPYWKKIEKAIRPRYFFMVEGIGDRWIGIMSLVLAILLSLPIPAGNLLPGIALAILSLGLIQRDGGAVMIGYGLSIISITWIGILIWSGEQLWRWAMGYFFS